MRLVVLATYVALCPLALYLAGAGAGTQTGGAAPGRPNILFAIADDWSFGHAGAYGSRWVKTPAFDRVARDGVLFTRAYTPNAKCAPSRAILLTGRHSWQLEEAANHVPFFPAKFKTWVEALRDAGYTTGLTGKGWAPGVANDASGQPRQLAGRPVAAKAPPREAEVSGIDYAANFETFLESAPAGQPWTFWYGASEPHRGYEYGSGLRQGKRLTDIDRVPGYWPDTDVVRTDMLDYAVEVERFDRHLGRMLELLEARGLLDNTIVIVTSDHGMPFPRVKGQAYEFSTHVPLAVMWRRGIESRGQTAAEFVSFVDIAPTLLDFAGVPWSGSGMQEAAGRTLRDVLTPAGPGRAAADRDHVLVGKERHDVGRPRDEGYPIRGIITEEAIYLRNYEPSRWPAGNPETGYLNVDGSPTKSLVLERHRTGIDSAAWQLAFGLRPGEELYDLREDPDALTNLAGVAAHRARAAALRSRMEAALQAQGDPRQFGKGDVFDRYVYADERTRGFYERYLKGEPISAGWVNPQDFEPAK